MINQTKLYFYNLLIKNLIPIILLFCFTISCGIGDKILNNQIPNIGDIESVGNIDLKEKGTDLLVSEIVNQFKEEEPISTSFADVYEYGKNIPDYPANDVPQIYYKILDRDKKIMLKPGIYDFYFGGYCLHSGKYAISKGAGYLIAPLKGKKADIIKHILQNFHENNILTTRIQFLIWAIESGVKYDELADEQKLIVNKLLTADEIRSMNKTFWEKIDALYQKIPSPQRDVIESKLPPEISESLNNARELKSEIINKASDAEITKTALKSGVAPYFATKITNGVWSLSPKGYYVRVFAPYGVCFGQIRIQLYIPQNNVIKSSIFNEKEIKLSYSDLNRNEGKKEIFFNSFLNLSYFFNIFNNLITANINYFDTQNSVKLNPDYNLISAANDNTINNNANNNSYEFSPAELVAQPANPGCQRGGIGGPYNDYNDNCDKTCNNNKVDIDWGFMQQQEGNKLEGYIPTDNGKADGNPLENSGVTIASGFDLGQHSPQEIENYGFSEDIVNKLLPYAGLIGQTAKNKLDENKNNDNNLEITDPQAQEINAKVKKAYTDDIINKFNNSSLATKFEDLCPESQTVIASVAFQNGDLQTAAPNFWKQITAQDWTGAIDNLQNFTPKTYTSGKDKGKMLYNNRRNAEATQLKNLCSE